MKMNAAVRAKEEIFEAEQTPPPALPKAKPLYLGLKRLFDIVLALLACVLCLIPCGIIALAIRLDSPGQVIFRQERLGKDGKPFVMYKFRYMRTDAEQNGPQWAEKYDTRCTRVGAFLRRSRLDELPQMINILKGDMSFVGPRPERKVFYDLFETYIPGFYRRLQVKPGLTGLAQVSGGYDLGPEEKIVYDMEYIRHQSVWMDLRCMLMTVHIVLHHEGAR